MYYSLRYYKEETQLVGLCKEILTRNSYFFKEILTRNTSIFWALAVSKEMK